jgi:hypothetical protein
MPQLPDIRNLTALGRLIDIRYSSNLFVVVASVLGGAVALGYLLLTDGDDPLLWAFRMGAGVFLSWAIARELDPDHPIAAGIAAVAGGAAVALAAPEIGAMAGFLIASRVVVRTTGLSPHPWELAALIGFAGYLAASQAGWPAAIALVWAMWIDGGHTHAPHPPAKLAAIVAAAVAIIVAVFTFPTDFALDRGWGATIVYLIGIVAAWISVHRLRVPTSRGDHDNAPLSPHRLAQGRTLAGAGLGLAAVVTTLEPAAYAPLWAALVATAVVTLTARRSEKIGV